MNKLLEHIARLRDLVTSVESEELISLHFFSETFDLVYKIQESLISLETRQIEHLQRDIELRKIKLVAPLQTVRKELEQLSMLQTEAAETAETAEDVITKIVKLQPDVSSPNATMKKESGDIRKLLSLNDRFRFQRELFNGDAATFNNTLETLNAIFSYAEAIEYIRSEMGWNEEEEITTEFYNVLERFYSL